MFVPQVNNIKLYLMSTTKTDLNSEEAKIDYGHPIYLHGPNNYDINLDSLKIIFFLATFDDNVLKAKNTNYCKKVFKGIIHDRRMTIFEKKIQRRKYFD